MIIGHRAPIYTSVGLRLVLVVHLEETILAGVQMVVQSTLGCHNLCAELAGVDEGAGEVGGLDVLEQSTSVDLGFLAQFATKCCPVVKIFTFFQKVREVSRIAVRGLKRHVTIFDLRKIFIVGRFREFHFIVVKA